MNVFYGHPTCSTCKKAEKWLQQEGISYEWKNIKEETPDRELLRRFLEKGQLTRKRLFNTSGNLYKELNLKDQIESFSLEEVLDQLQADGMLIRRPFLTNGEQVSVGFKEETYTEMWQA